MGCSGLLILGLVLNVAHCLEILGQNGEPILYVEENVTAILGEDVYLTCRYLGERQIQGAEWKFLTKVKSKRLAGFLNNQSYSRLDDFSVPASVTNLTVKMHVSSVQAEGEYSCEFESEEESYSHRVSVKVVAQPDIQILVTPETMNGSHYQSVSCSAIGGRPAPQISWLVKGLPPSDYPFTVDVRDTVNANGTFTQSSILRFPTHLQDEKSVTCVVQHPTFRNRKATTVRVETYTKPNVIIKAKMVQQEGSEFWVVSCVSSGGRPDTDISLALNTDEELQHENNKDSGRQISTAVLPAAEYEGHNVTCVFDHPKFTEKVSHVITLPSFYSSGVQLLYSEFRINSDDFQDSESLELQEGKYDTVISLPDTRSDVLHHNVTCRKDEGPLPEDVELIGRSLTVRGPVGRQHAGLYECFISNHHLRAVLKFNVTVKLQVIQTVPPTIQVDLKTEDGHRMIECAAADAVPAANMSWLLPEGVSGVSWFNFTSHNGSHSVRGVLLLPACSPLELTAECVINHPAFEEPQNRSITLPPCARPDITVSSSTEWKDGEQYTEVDCSVDSVASAAAITWHVGNSSNSLSHQLSDAQVRADGFVSARSSVHVLSALYAGQDLTCIVEHPSLEAPERRTIRILVHKALQMSVSVVRKQDSPLWLAVCACRGESTGTNLTWVLPENAKKQTSLRSEYEGHVLKARLTYEFPLALHEGQNLTCVHHFEHGATERKTVHVPRYYISSVRVVNHTTPLQSRYGGEPVVHRLSLQENHHNQRIFLRVEGNVPDYNLNCERSDGGFVFMEGDAMVFQSAFAGSYEGLYTCWASFYHHRAAVNIQVEVMSEDQLFAVAAVICFSLATAIMLILAVTLWACCCRNSKDQYQKRESLSALTALMQEHGSPEVKKQAVTVEGSKENAQQVNYAIVIDIKSTV